MIGFIVKHNGEGLGKIRDVEGARITVDFLFPPRTLVLVAIIDGRKTLKHALLPLNTLCAVPEGQCRIIKAIPGPTKLDPHSYQVELADGLAKEVSETQITPLEISRSNSPLEALCELNIEGYATFQKREALVEAWQTSIRGALGLRALLSSRIDLRPHQAYVAGTVLMDRLPRYLLADEVGLGKTIEAGIVIHDLLERKPGAKVLILCPSALAQQWLCELYAKFSGRVFNLLGLRHSKANAGAIPDRMIASFPAALKHSSRLLQCQWDMIVVDEVHNILGAQRLYGLVKNLSAATPGCLLLSAIPAQHREQEYLRLLALLEPQRYQAEDPQEQMRFKSLYDRQIEMGRKLNYISRRLADFTIGAETAEPVLKKISELAAMPFLSQDEVLASMAKRLDASDPGFADLVHSLLHYVGNHYRISRRILRNRRSQLVSSQADLNTVRRLNLIPHKPDQLELDAWAAVRQLLQSLLVAKVPGSVLLPLAKLLFHSLCDPDCLKSLISLATSRDLVLADLLEFDGQVSYDGWEEYSKTLWEAVGAHLTDAAVQEVARVADVWRSGVERTERIASLLKFLRARHKAKPDEKFIVFAGYFGLADRLAAQLEIDFPNAAIARFVWNMESKAKEKEVMRFKRDSQCWLMISDETGGEGRNFQFVDEIVHFDVPWHVSKIEQRIGRLDRLGRKHPEVCSNVLYAEGEEESGLLRCYDMGFQVFTRSVSGLEFALSHLEARIAQVALGEGHDGLHLLADEIKNGAEGERASDDVQGILDAASLDRKSAEVFRRAQSTPERDLQLEQAFCEYFQYIAGPRSLRHVCTGEYPEGIYEFRPDQLRELDVSLSPTLTGTHADRTGTFRRQVAQESPNIEFFSVGNEFFDAVCATLNNSSKGRAYAVECSVPSRAPWRGFEFCYRPFGRRDLLKQHSGLLKHLDRVLAVRGEHVFVSEVGQVESDVAGFFAVRKSLKREAKDLTWWNFTLKNEQVKLLSDRYAVPGWEVLVNRSEAVARSLAKARLSLVLAPAFDEERLRIEEQVRQAKSARADGWEDEIRGLESLLLAMEEWDVELDVAGFLSINGGIMT